MEAEHDKNEELVFVYGTLRREGSNAFRMQRARWVADASVNGRLFRVDWYPGLVLDAEAGPVVGEVYAVVPWQLTELDDYEGPEYRRVAVDAIGGDGVIRRVWVWEWIRRVDGLREIVGGDWLAGER